jgi:putative DNA primase/helicase
MINKYVKKSKNGKYNIDVDKLALDLQNEDKFITIFNKRGEDILIYNYDIGIYEYNGREVLKRKIEDKLQEWAKIHGVDEIIEKIKRQTATSWEKFNDVPINLIPLKNGYYDIIAQKFSEHNTQNHFTSIIPIKYDKKADCPLIKKFFEDTFYEKDIPVIQEWFGFNLYKQYFIKKAVILFGKKNTGKTQVISILTKFIGEKNKTGIPLQDISRNNKFQLASLFGKYSNIYDDLSFADLKDAGGFKVATGGGWITAEHKFGDTFQFQPFAKHIFATNKIPIIATDDEAYYLRWLPIACDNEVSEAEQDKFLIQRICTDEEMSGLFNWALEGLRRLLERGKFSFNLSVPEIQKLMEKHSNSLAMFVQNCLIEKTGSRITKEEMFRLFLQYADENSLYKLSKEQIGRRLQKCAIWISDKVENKVRYWENVEIKP